MYNRHILFVCGEPPRPKERVSFLKQLTASHIECIFYFRFLLIKLIFGWFKRRPRRACFSLKIALFDQLKYWGSM